MNERDEKKYWITEKQFDNLDHYARMFELNAGTILDLCSSGKDDVVYGFELGKIHSHLRECFMTSMDLVEEIRNQEVTLK